MDGGGSIGQNEVLSPEGGGGDTGILFQFYIFQIVVYHLEINKMDN